MIRRSSILLHIGRKGSGKSWAAKRLADKQTGRVSVWDPNCEWAGGADGLKIASLTITSLAQFVQKSRKVGGRPHRVLIFQLGPSEFDRWADWAMRAGDQTLYIDEAPLVLRANKMTPTRERLITTSRHRRINLVLCAQRPKHLAPDVRAQADAIRCWHCIEKGDLDAIADTTGSAFAARLPKLKGHASATWKA